MAYLGYKLKLICMDLVREHNLVPFCKLRTSLNMAPGIRKKDQKPSRITTAQFKNNNKKQVLGTFFYYQASKSNSDPRSSQSYVLSIK